MTVDDSLLTMLRTLTGVDIYDGDVDADESEKIVLVDLPYAVFYSSLGSEFDERTSGRRVARSVSFQVMFVGETREQARWAGEKCRAVLSGKRPTLTGKSPGLIVLADSLLIRREDTYTRPGGGPLFYGVDQYEVTV